MNRPPLSLSIQLSRSYKHFFLPFLITRLVPAFFLSNTLLSSLSVLRLLITPPLPLFLPLPLYMLSLWITWWWDVCVCVCARVALAVLSACVFRVHRVCHVAFTQFQRNTYCLPPPTQPPRCLFYGLLTTADHRVYMRTLLQITVTYITLRVRFSYPDHIPARMNIHSISMEYVLSRVRYGIYNSCQIIRAPPSSYIWVS